MSLDDIKPNQGSATNSSIFSLKNMRTIRLAKGMTQQQLADKAGLNRRQISFYETGWKVPGLEGMLKIAEALRAGNTQLKVIDTTGKENTVEVLCAVEIPETDRTSYIYRKTNRGYLVSKRRV